jgi:protein-tyrosine-phosphatase
MADALTRILFVCIGNTCRSQMAEGFARRLGDGRVEAMSAGTAAMGVVNRATIAAMRDAGVSFDGHSSKQLTPEMFAWADVVVTMGCSSAESICPASYAGLKYDWPIEDPLGGPPEVLRRVRDDIEKRVRALIAPGHRAEE